MTAIEFAQHAEQLGWILLTSTIERNDEWVRSSIWRRAVCGAVGVPVIAHGGAGKRKSW
jgi:imidazole glycerol phosphate synthase subunit HisF